MNRRLEECFDEDEEMCDRRWYAVLVDDEPSPHDEDYSYGSEDYDEALKMAENAHKEYPEMQIEICVTNVYDDFCYNCFTVYEEEK